MLLVLLFLPFLSLVGPIPSARTPGAPAAFGVASASSGTVQPSAALLSFAIVASVSQAQPKDVVAFTVHFNNTGNQSAPTTWINVTAASGYAFLGDTATGNVSGYPDYRFANLPLGLHSFRLSLQVDVGVAPGSRLAVSATLVYADGTGAEQFLGPSSASVLVGVVFKPLYLGWSALTPGILTPVTPTGSLLPQGTFTLTPGGAAMNFDLTPPLAHAFRSLNATAVLYLQPVSPASLDLNLTLIDLNGAATTVVSSVERTYAITGSGYWTLSYTFPAMNALFASGHQIRLQVLSTASSGQSALLATNATTTPSRVLFQTPTYVNIDSLLPRLAPTTYLSPKSSLVVAANVSDPFGSSEVVAAHLNVTGPGAPLSGWASPFPVVARDPSTPSKWVLFQQSFPPLLANGTYSIEVTAVERNGALSVADTAAVVRAPGFTLQKIASPNQGKTGTRITYFLWYNNTGSGPAARVWLNDTLPSQVSFLNASVNPTSVSGNTYAWVLSNVAVGPHVLMVFVQVRGGISGVSYIRNWASLNDSDPQGFLWPALTSHADVVLNGPALGLSQSTNPAASVHANQSVRFTIHLANAGDAAAKIWLNDTVPAGLVYVSDTATTVGGTRTIVGNVVHWTFPGMPSGTVATTYLNFTMDTRASGGLAMGTLLRNTIGLNATSTNNVLMPDQLSSLALLVVSPSIVSARASFGVSSAVPNAPLPLYVNFTNAGNEAAGTTWINLTLTPTLSLVNATVNATLSNSTLALELPRAGLGPDSVRVVLAADRTVASGDILSAAGTLVAVDGYGNLLPAVPVSPADVTVELPGVSFSVNPTAATMEAGTSMGFTVTGGNSGTGTASAVWLNLTLPAGLAYVSDTFSGVRTGSTLSWVWRPYAPGSASYSLVLAATVGAVDNITANFAFSVQAFDAGGNAEAPLTFGASVLLRAPRFALEAWADQNRSQVGPDPFTFTLTARNAGSTMAQTLWLTSTVDAHLALISYDAPVSASGTTTLNWTFHDVTPGQTIVITLLVRVLDGTSGNTQLVGNLQASYTNSGGLVLGSAPPASAVVSVQPNWAGLFVILLGGSLVGGLVVFLMYRRYRVEIEDVFLIYRDGILVSHLTEANQLEKDEDQLSGMLTAVQDFVKDAFTYGEHRELHQLEFGDYHVLIERGKVVYLAVVYRGRDSGMIRKRVRTVLDRVESAYGKVFDAWDGDVSEVSGTWDLLRQGFVEDKHPWSLVKSRTT